MASLAVFLVMGGGAYASVNAIGGGGVIHGCYSKRDGALRVVGGGASCSKKEKALAWNEQGRPGPQGSQGAAGANGAAGAAGAAGAQGAAGAPGAPGQDYTAPAQPSNLPMTLVLNPGSSSAQNIPLTGVSFGGSVQPPAGGSGAGTVTLSPINFSKARDASSAQLLDDSLSRRTISSAALEAFSPNSSTPFMTWTITNVTVSSYQFNDAPADRSDNGILEYQAISSSFDSTAPYAVPSNAQAGEMVITPSGGGGSSFTVPIYDNQWGEAVSSSSGANDIRPLTVVTAVDQHYAALWQTLMGGPHFATVTITLHDPGASAATVYTLTNPSVTEIWTSSGPSLLDEVSFDFTKIDVKVPTASGGTSESCWDLTNQMSCTPKGG